MNREFVDYKTALALKELGFNEPCISDDFYKDGKIMINYADDYITNTEHDRLTKECNDDNMENGEPLVEEGATIPLISQAFRWFREKHNLQHEIYYQDGLIMNLYKIIDILTNNDLTDYISKEKWFDVGGYTYEEAEQACLDKLIEIVKNK